MTSRSVQSVGEIYKMLEQDEKYLVSFKRSVGYLKLLAELDLLKVGARLFSRAIAPERKHGSAKPPTV